MILILGASSFVGGHLARTCPPGTYLGTYNTHPVERAVRFDATTMQLDDVLPAGQAFSHGVVLFAEPDIDACKADMRRSHELNVSSAIRVIDSLLRLGIKPVFISSEQVFDGERGGYAETDTPTPINLYGEQKLQVEQYLAAHAADYAVLRFAKVFGTDPADKTIFSGWLRQIHRGDEIVCARDQIFSPIHVGDVVAAMQAVVARNLSGIYHLAGPEAHTRLGMLQTLIARGGLTAKVRECSYRDFAFLDRRARDVSMTPAKILDASGLTFRTIASCCDELLEQDARIRC